MSYLDLARTQLAKDEGVRAFPYEDIFGNVTVGCGRNLTGVGLSQDEIRMLFENDLATADRLARSLVPKFEDLAEVRRAVLVNMAFNLSSRLKGFVQFIEYVNSNQWSRAADEMLDSQWARQVGYRAKRLAKQMRDGE
jgi:lysozyme